MDTPHPAPTSERLNKYLAFHLGVSRRQADTLIKEGAVTINGKIATLGDRAQPGDSVTANGTPVATKEAYTYVLLHKPRGYVCSRRQQGELPTIYSLLPKSYHHLKPVGRLDADSSGLLLLTDDGDFTFAMTHPKFYKQKQYLVLLSDNLQPLHRQMINDFGVTLEDGPSKLTLERQNEGDDRGWVVTMSEGRNRQIRRTFQSLGYTVKKLHRTHFGRYTLDDLKRGEWILTKKI